MAKFLFATHQDMLGPFTLLSLRASPRAPSVRQVAAQMLRQEQMAVVRAGSRAQVRAIPNPSVPGGFIESPGWLAALQGYGGLGNLGYLGTSDLGIGPLKFQNDHAARNFIDGYGGQGGCDDRGGTWSGAGPAVSLAATRYAEYKAASDYSAGAMQFLESWEAGARSLIADVDRLQQFDAGGVLQCGRSDGREVQYKAALRNLKNKVLALANAAQAPVPAQPPPVELQVQNQATQTVDTGSRPPSMRTPQNRGPDFFQRRSEMEGGGVQEKEKKFPWVPVLVAGGILVVGSALLLMRRK